MAWLFYILKSGSESIKETQKMNSRCYLKFWKICKGDFDKPAHIPMILEIINSLECGHVQILMICIFFNISHYQPTERSAI